MFSSEEEAPRSLCAKERKIPKILLIIEQTFHRRCELNSLDGDIFNVSRTTPVHLQEVISTISSFVTIHESNQYAMKAIINYEIYVDIM